MTDSPTGFNPQPSQAVFRKLTRGLRAEGDLQRTEAVTGRMADIAAGREGAIAEVLDLDKAHADLETYRDTIGLAQSRAQVLQQALTRIEDGTNRLLQQATTALQAGTTVPLGALSATARDTLGAFTGALNTSFAGRSLFAGDESDAGAVTGAPDLLASADAAIAGAATPGDAVTALADLFNDATAQPVYLGGTGDAPAAEVAPGERVAYHVRADEQVLRDTLRGVATIAAALDPTTPGALTEDERRQLAEDAVGELRNLGVGMNTLRAEIGSAEARIEQARMRNIAEETRLTAALNSLTGRDELEAAARMQAVEGQLETLFLTTARFSQLSLANFLR